VVEDGPHLRVAGDSREAEDGAEVAVHGPAAEGEQGRVLQAEQGQAGHQGVSQAELRAAALLRQRLEAAPGQRHQGVEVEVAALTPASPLAHGRPPVTPVLPLTLAQKFTKTSLATPRFPSCLALAGNCCYVTTDGGFLIPHESGIQDAKLVRIEAGESGWPLLQGV